MLYDLIVYFPDRSVQGFRLGMSEKQALRCAKIFNGTRYGNGIYMVVPSGCFGPRLADSTSKQDAE